jgi:hypothetical protein
MPAFAARVSTSARVEWERLGRIAREPREITKADLIIVEIVYHSMIVALRARARLGIAANQCHTMERAE